MLPDQIDDQKNFKHHSSTFGRNSQSIGGDFNGVDAGEEQNGKVGTVHRPTDLLLGVAGYIPRRHPDLEGLNIPLHELWMRSMREHTRVYPTGNSIAVFYGSFYAPPSSFDTTPHKIRAAAEQTLFAATLFVTEVELLQQTGRICDSLPILSRKNGYRTLIQVKTAEFSIVRDLYGRLNAVVDFCRGDFGQKSDSKDDWLTAARKTVISVLSYVFSPKEAGPVVAGRDEDRPPTSKASVGYTELPQSFMDLKRAAKFILRDLGLGATVPGVYHFHPVVAMEQILHIAASCVQILCLGLQSFVRAHTGMPQFALLDHEATEIHLNGCEIPQSKRIVAYLQKLTCLGDMTKRPVLVFEERQSPQLRDAFPELDDTAPCDLHCSLEDVIDIWGGARVEFVDTGTKEDQSNIIRMHIGGGVLYPTGHDGAVWHWMSEDDPELPRTLEALQERYPKVSIHRREKIRIGTLSVNRDCPLSTDEGQRVLHRISRDHIQSLQAFAPHWQLNPIQGGIQGGQYIVPQFMLGWKKMPGHTEKQNLLNPSNNTLLPELSNIYGVQISLCTGLMYRVPLRDLIASRIKSYIRSRGPSLDEWYILDQLDISEAFHKPNLRDWFLSLPNVLHKPAWTLVKEILCQLQHTRIDHENMLRVGWVQENDALKCLKIQCSGSNAWAKMLTDSPDVVTFACVAPICMESPSERHRCRWSLPRSYELKRVLQLYTRVRPMGVDHYSSVVSDGWTLQDGKSYWIGREDLMMLATVSRRKGITQLSVKRSAMPTHLFKRMNGRVTLRETNDEGAVECFIGSPESFAQEEAANRANVATVPLTVQSSPLTIRAASTATRVT